MQQDWATPVVGGSAAGNDVGAVRSGSKSDFLLCVVFKERRKSMAVSYGLF
ncbi:hypothetical protein H1S01_08615 [Heliobacterium chlorum]|uniref:Uncharacterized protein n=1 Tax=Heliobacterium chlorum TaxID=2698 RepID=A0ABR7T2L0_HELCL|nr:hypothetical protein [Heliobacterium chlorum]MBC9784575.1 hypothetical protein [Heliobacterium chlorum]